MADNMIAGTVYLTIDSKSCQLVGEFAYRPTQNTNETLKGLDGIHGLKSVPEAGMIKAKLRDSGSISIQELGNATDVTVVASLANGKTVIGRNMWRAGEPLEVDAEDGTFSIQWEGADVSEA
ncbi:phage tail tube protein [Sphingomonas sp. CBMAI 2297]|uniref:phage tail tube protein n=1 Tax=Sphingomonas sp. CBMAI 2297 TaxID=2991720 RepID=UPI002457605A|nr:phage tail tube protein [Sphingomonas sp. CBMAI 2297]MDH4745823.1 phage tail tube protein [Sphingomonas sp. CBMAI 2297]